MMQLSSTSCSGPARPLPGHVLSVALEGGLGAGRGALPAHLHVSLVHRQTGGGHGAEQLEGAG